MTEAMTGTRSGVAAHARAPSDADTRGTAAPGVPAALLTALTTDHFVLQSAASTTVSEAVGRSSLYTSSLSASLVALGFASDRSSILLPLVAIMTPTVFVLGVFTAVRLVDTGVANLSCLAAIARIRQRYASLSPEAVDFFPTGDGRRDQALGSLGTRAGALTGLFTTASMIAVVNSIIGGVGVGLLIRHGVPSIRWVAVFAGVLVFLTCMAIFLRYQDHRYRTTAM